METEEVPADPAVANGGTGDVNVKQEDAEKDIKFGIGEVKTEPASEKNAGEEESSGRSTRKRKLNSMAESDLSDESADENLSKSAPKKRGRGGGRTSTPRGRGRGKADVPKNMADPSRNPRIVLKNIASDSQDEDGQVKANMESPRGRGRGRGRGARAPARAPRGGGRSAAKPKSKAKPVSEEEEEEDDDFDMEELDDEDDDEDFVPKKKKGGGRQAKQAVSRGRKGKRGSKVTQDSENEDDDDDDDDDNDDGDEEEEGAEAAADNSTDNNPNAVKTGQYLIEKNDMKRLENYPIWRMEGPNMLRKFEMMVADGKVRHKSLYAYSSWAQSMLDLYEKIQVKQISSSDGETVVEIKEEFLPRPPELGSLESKYAGDNLLNFYNIYVQAMFQQAVDPNFLKKVKSENDTRYLDAINYIDSIIKEKIAFIESQVSMKEEFKTRVKNCPNMKSIRRQNWSQTDQATTNKTTEKGVRSVLMFGYGYDPFLMEEDKSRGVEVAQEVVIGNTMEQYLASYHGLTHFKFTLLRRCQDKSSVEKDLSPGLPPGAVLEKCLNDRVWILQTFDDLKTLLAVDNNQNQS